MGGTKTQEEEGTAMSDYSEETGHSDRTKSGGYGHQWGRQQR